MSILLCIVVILVIVVPVSIVWANGIEKMKDDPEWQKHKDDPDYWDWP